MRGVFGRVAIRGFASNVVRRFFETGEVNRKVGWFGVAKVVARKLDMLEYAAVLQDLSRPPANRLEALRGNLRGMHSIRVSDQWRAVFRWTPSGPIGVNVVECH
jgi:proteic killer suppression protein